MMVYKKIILGLISALLFLFSLNNFNEENFVNAQIKRNFSSSLRDPFALPSGIRHLSKETVPQKEKKIESISELKPQTIKPQEIPLKLKAILISEHIRLASIDQKVLTIGDEINGEKVIDIQSDRVILGKGEKRRTILLDQNPLKITVEQNIKHK